MMTPFPRLAKTALFFVFCCSNFLFHLPAFAQKEANFWYFGYMAGLDFSSGSPVQLNDSAIEAFEGCATISDSLGNLLFYTNGGGAPNGLIPNGPRTGYIWNRNHEVMYDMGDSEGGGYSAAQNSLILPVPGVANQYYLFTIDQQPSLSVPTAHRGLSYFIVDMALNGGLGGVSVANQTIHKPATESLTAVRHQNGSDYWLVTIDKVTEDFLIVPVTSAGIGTPFLQPRMSNNSGTLVIKASPDGTFLFADYQLYRFNPANGTVNFLQQFIETNYYEFSFSPESRYFYTLSSDFGDTLLRYDVTAPDILASRQAIAEVGFSFPAGMQIGPDGNIYLIEITVAQAATETTAISTIRCPDSDSPTLERFLFEFETEASVGVFIGLPNFPDFLFQSIEPDLVSDTVEICAGETVFLESDFIGENYSWSTGETAASIGVQAPGEYIVTISDACDRPIAVHTFSVTWSDIVPIEEAEETVIKCTGENVSLVSSPAADVYAWSTGESSSSITVAETGTYKVTITEACSAKVVTFFVEEQSQPVLEFRFEAQPPPCAGDTVRLEALAIHADFLLWSNGDTNAVTQAVAGETYSVTAGNVCGEVTESLTLPGRECCDVYLPNVFSPNGDGLNDTFQPYFYECGITEFRMKIFSRWGAVVFESDDPALGWDGRFHGKELPPDVFVFYLQYHLQTLDGPVVVEKGADVILIR